MNSQSSHRLNIAFDGKSAEELVDFVKSHIANLAPTELPRVHIKVNDLLAETWIYGLKELTIRIEAETGIKITWMIDGKWNDIPNTVANYAKRLEWLDVAYYTVHASGGPEMIRAAKNAAPDKKLLAITVLTSMKDDEVRDIYDADRAESILRLAKSALGAGADGLVCSPADAPMLREVFGEDFLLVTPNIAREWIERNDDQNKALTNTPRGAVENGVSDIVVGRPILTAENPGSVIAEMLNQMDKATPNEIQPSQFAFEKLLHTGDWELVLKYIGAIYRKGENGKYVRLTSGFLSDTYINIGATERDYRVMARASDELADQMRAKWIQGDIVMGAQMGSVRLSLPLAQAMSITTSIYTEKDGDSMKLGRHDLGETGFEWKKIILSEDVITKGSTLAKMMEIVKSDGGEVVGITCVVNRSGKDNYDGIPLFHCYVPPTFGMWWDEKTLEKTRANELATGKSEDEANIIVENIKTKNAPLPEDSQIAEKPKNEWNTLVASMR